MISAQAGRALARRPVRRWLVVGYWLFIVLFAVSAVRWPLYEKNNIYILWLPLILQLPALLGGVRRGGLVKPFRRPGAFVTAIFPAASDEVLDERETRQRDLCHYYALVVSRWLSLIVFLAVLFLSLGAPQLVARLGLSLIFLLAAVLWSLPQSILLWNEPDFDDEL